MVTVLTSFLLIFPTLRVLLHICHTIFVDNKYNNSSKSQPRSPALARLPKSIINTFSIFKKIVRGATLKHHEELKYQNWAHPLWVHYINTMSNPVYCLHRKTTILSHSYMPGRSQSLKRGPFLFSWGFDLSQEFKALIISIRKHMPYIPCSGDCEKEYLGHFKAIIKRQLNLHTPKVWLHYQSFCKHSCNFR